MGTKIQYQFRPENLKESEPNKYQEGDLRSEELIINLGPQHPSTHGVLRLEVILDGEIVKEVVPHLGYLHRCFEKHAEALPFNQIIPYVDRLDYIAAMNSEHAYAMGVEKMLGITEQIPKRVEYIRVLVAELNRIASHFVAVGTYGMDIGALTPFFWLIRDGVHFLRIVEWASGARMLYNYILIGGLFYDLPVGFEKRCLEFIHYLNFGGYPEVVFSDRIQSDMGRNVKNDIVDKVLLRDLHSLYGIKDVQELNRFFTYIAYNTGNEFSYETMSRESGIQKDTLKKYLEYF